jgi:tyrosine-specific transport protein
MSKKPSVFSVALLICGATIGAGILGLPVQTGLSGFFPALFGIIVIWCLMSITAIIIAERFMRSYSYTNDFPSIFKKDFGTVGKYLSVFGYLVNYYGVMVAYLCGAASILAYLVHIPLPSWAFLLIFFIPTAIVTLYGLSYVLRANFLFMIILFITFIILLVAVGYKLLPSRLLFTDWPFLPAAMPIILNAFLFHNIVPAVTRSLEHDRAAIYKSIILGTSIACIINILWIIVVIGSLPMTNIKGGESLCYAFLHNQPATVPLASLLKSKIITIAGMVFSFCAIFTSFVSVVIGLRGFLRDFIVSTFKVDNTVLTVLATFIPPLAVAIIFPNFFLGALNFAGGVGGVLIFGIFPALILIKYARGHGKRIFGILLLIVFICLMGCELLQEFGVLKIKPHVELWNNFSQNTALKR